MKSITQGLFAGHNINVIIKRNYPVHVPMGVMRNSATSMINTSAGVDCNIIRSANVGIVVKATSVVCIYNNTLYQARITSETGRNLKDIYSSSYITPGSVSHGTKNYNCR